MHEHDGDSQADTHRREAESAGDGLDPADPAVEDERLLELLERWEERFRDDENAAPDSFGIDDPALMQALRERIELAKKLYAFMRLAPLEQAGREAAGGDCPPPPPAPSLPPAHTSMIGRYRVLRVLGEGGFGRVYLAYDGDLQREVAVKVPLPGDASRFLDVEAYLREARIVARLNHPNIVPVYDVGRTEDGRCFVVSKFMEGGDLKGRLARGRPAFAESAGLVAVLCDALQYTHTQDLFHRDIKPANVLLDAAGAPSLADFGLALRDEDVGRGAGYLGTAAYMSPEQARGEGHRVDGRSDIFSMGVVLYEMLTGRRPFRGASHPEIMHQVISAEPRPPRQIDDAIPSELERICLKALAKRASERYTTARDLAEDLRHFLATVSWDAPTSEAPPVTPSSRETSPVPAPTASDSNVRPIRIVPKGLGSFDEHDADFFLELLPGARDRDGLPDGLRFWKTRIETTDPDRAFRVGLIYGPSGCGKSSMVKAGLLPRLAPQICAIYAEASGSETESRLLRSLRRLFPALPADGGLAEGLKALRRGHGLPAGRKVLLVLDQFEQRLFARRDGQGDELIAALRQCDGERVQALCLVRDDFWMAATRFMKELDIELVPERNVAAVDLFETRHARRVLAAYGRAYDALPPRSGDLSRDQDAFLDQAVSGLAQDGLVVPVRLALFAEMVKGRPWTPVTLRDVGGMDGVGVKFLEDTFSSPRSNPNHRYHQRAAQAVLKALLPETDADIKGRMRSVEDLRTLSGYADRPTDFADLIRMLDSELRLITPVDPEGSVDEDAPSPAPGGRYFQLTHDYLVHALREWLTRKQRETRRGRAELLLAERAALWAAKPEDRYLPSAREWAIIRLLTSRKDWKETPRRMMQRAGRRIGLLGLGMAIAVGVLAIGIAEAYNRMHVDGLVTRLASADTTRAPDIIREVQRSLRRAEPQLRRIIAEAPDHSKEKLHASLALLPIDELQIEYLYGRLLNSDSAEAALLRDGLQPYSGKLSERLWGELRQARPHEEQILAVASVLARFDPDNPAWSLVGDRLVAELGRAPLGELLGWRESMRGIRRFLRGPLAKILQDESRRDEHISAARMLADYAADAPAVLSDSLLDADPNSFEILFPAVRDRRGDCVAELRAAVELARPGPAFEARAAKDAAGGKAPASPADLERAKDRIASRGAHAAVALLRLDPAEDVWDLLAYRPDPRLRTAFINDLPALGADPALVAGQFARLAGQRPDSGAGGGINAYLFDPVISTRRALIMALAGYPKEALAPGERDMLVRRVERLYTEDPDSGVHSATELLLRRWSDSGRLKVPPGGDRDGRRWYVNREDQTMVLMDGPVVFNMGSTDTDSERNPEETCHRQEIPRPFFIASREVTIAEFRRFAMEEFGDVRPFDNRYGSVPDGPIMGINWYEAAGYCNWLSDREHLPRCYKRSPKGKYDKEMTIDADNAHRGGYRLPTEAEWEYSCRAGTTTSRYTGMGLDHFGRYEWYVSNSGRCSHPCGQLLPNDFGLFDMLGNAMEWCNGKYSDSRRKYDMKEVVRDEIRGGEVGLDARHLRGGGFRSDPSTNRSSNGAFFDAWGRHSDIGFRPVRTRP